MYPDVTVTITLGYYLHLRNLIRLMRQRRRILARRDRHRGLSPGEVPVLGKRVRQERLLEPREAIRREAGE